MLIPEAGVRCRNRELEWMTTFMLLSFGATTFITPATLGTGAFKYLLALGLGPFTFGIICFAVGLARMHALIINGRGLPWTARVRAVCAVLGAILFSFLALSLAFLTKDTGTISLGVGTHAILACVEIYSCLKAGVDAKHRELGFTAPR